MPFEVDDPLVEKKLKKIKKKDKKDQKEKKRQKRQKRQKQKQNTHTQILIMKMVHFRVRKKKTPEALESAENYTLIKQLITVAKVAVF